MNTFFQSLFFTILTLITGEITSFTTSSGSNWSRMTVNFDVSSSDSLLKLRSSFSSPYNIDENDDYNEIVTVDDFYDIDFDVYDDEEEEEDEETILWNKRSKKWLILVDDEESIRQSLGQFLFDQGYQVTACVNPNTALDVLCNEKKNKLPDAIITDIRMPPTSSISDNERSIIIEDGLKFLQYIRDKPELMHIPVIILTAKGTTKDRIAGFQSGADSYLPKPFDPFELLAIVDNLIQRQELLIGNPGEDGKTVEEQSFDNIQEMKSDLWEIKDLILRAGGLGVADKRFQKKTGVYLIPIEKDVLNYVSQGLTNKEISSRMFLSKRRIEQHMTSMFRKTKTSNRTELIRWAISNGVINL